MIEKRYNLRLQGPYYTGDSYKLFIEGNLYLDFGPKDFIWKADAYDWCGLVWLMKSYSAL